MEISSEEQKAALVARATDEARARPGAVPPGALRALLAIYWSRVPAADLAGSDPADLAGAVRSHLELALDRTPGTARVRVYSPSDEDDGWTSTHSVVEVVTDDMPFLVDSVSMELVRQGAKIHLVAHPVVGVSRGAAGRLTGLGQGGAAEAFLHLEIDRQPDPERRQVLGAGIERVLSDVAVAVADWDTMRARALALAAGFQERPPPGDPDEVAEARDLLRFLADGNFVFLGYRDNDLEGVGEERLLNAVAGSGYGILRHGEPARAAGPSLPAARASGSFARVPPAVRSRAGEGGPVTVVRASANSTVHRAAPLDYVGVLRYDPAGRVVGEHRFLGLWTSGVHKMPVASVPVVRRTVAAVVSRAGFAPASHDGKALLEVLENHPRHELFEAGVDDVYTTALGILDLQERQRTCLFARRDRFGRFWSLLVFVPLDRYTQAVRQRITDVLVSSFAGTGYEYQAQVGGSVLARLHFLVHTDPAARPVPEGPAVDLDAVEALLVEVTRSFVDDLTAGLLDQHGEAAGTALVRRYRDAFPPAYRDEVPARTAVADVTRIEHLTDDAPVTLALSRSHTGPDGLLRARLFRLGQPVPLSDVLPLFERMGVRVVDQLPYEIRRPGGPPVWIHDFGLAADAVEAGFAGLEIQRAAFVDAFLAAWRGDVENDGFQGLVLGAGLTGSEAAVLRAYARYLRQIGTAYSQPYMEETLAHHPRVARLLVDLFRARFDPAHSPDPEDEATVVTKRLEAAVDAVAGLDEDRILRSFLTLVQATVRTNWFAPNHTLGRALALKLDPTRIPDMPLPRPRYEIFVCSPAVEGVHLRGGRVSRGGIRWSDRREDFRTEVLGLMKAQMVKNAVIVPVGAKGGFVVKGEVSPTEVAACYRAFISALLEVTDGINHGRAGARPVGGGGGWAPHRADDTEVVRPPGVLAHDGDDPYLVVAADKGTAAFSDLANEVSAEHRFWLGDAFASGGSAGYDHKALGITARGAWESVRRHFADVGVDADTAPLTVAGIGDMSGDVFGNGMLLSRHIRLVAAFDHRHVFIDPDPADPSRAFAERQRLFALPRSSWADYDPALISAGGGVYPRSAKSIPLTPEARRLLDVTEEADPSTRWAPSKLIRAILSAPVDLVWNGGIGTYVKSSAEVQADAGDKANDAVRIDATALRALVVVEGGNLGLTQRARVEYALGGGRIHTDAIDNSAGVDCSDHEVNIKILLDAVVADGELTVRQRDRLLAEMAGDVAEAVLADNRNQTWALALARAQAGSMADVHGRYLTRLEAEGRLDRALEFLPTEEALAARHTDDSGPSGGLTVPELAVVLAVTKIMAAAALVASDVPEALAGELAAYFPPALRDERFAAAMGRHPLRREIVAARLTNRLVDMAGTSFLHRLGDETAAGVPELTRAHFAAREIFDLDGTWASVQTLGPEISTAERVALALEVRHLAERAVRWLVRRPDLPPMAETIERYRPGAKALAGLVPGCLPAPDEQALVRISEAWTAGAVPEGLATAVAAMTHLHHSLDLTDAASTGGRTIEEAAAVFFEVGERLELDWLRARIEDLPRADRWSSRARSALLDDCSTARRRLTDDVLRTGGDLDGWIETHHPSVDRFLTVVDDLRAVASLDLATLSVAMREARALTG